jgi:diadenosine tetraphosphatase ApaH/serine/threonine PP2A family protein phosphatase
MSLHGVIAGIHGNREALCAALEALEARGARRIACLGDIVGYNADPDECVALVRARCAAALAGSLDLVAVGRLGWHACAPAAEYALRRARRALSAPSAAWLRALPQGAELDGFALAAGSEQIPGGAQLCFFGPGLEPKAYELRDGVLHELDAAGPLLLRTQNPCFVNPGSVDASRKRGRKLAQCALYDSERRTLEFLRVPYDGAAAEAKAAVFGYRMNALTDRLYALRRRLRPTRSMRTNRPGGDVNTKRG